MLLRCCWGEGLWTYSSRKPIRIDWGLLARVPMEVYQSPHSNSHVDNPPAQLAPKVKKKTKCAVCVLIGVIGKTTFSKKTCTALQREGKKSKTTLNAHWIRQFLDKNDDEYATQATFCLSHFDAMTQIVRAEPIPNDVKFHIILGQNWMKTQAKYDFFQKHNPISTSFCACCTKTLDFSHTKYTRNTLEVDLMMMKLCKTHVQKTARRVVYVYTLESSKR